MKEYKKANILITGGTGFFGRALLRSWMDHANKNELQSNICVLTRNPEKFLKSYPEFKNQNWLKFHCGDILYPHTLPLGGKFTHLLHAATDSTLGPQLKPIERYIQIIDGTKNMLEYAVTHNISRFLLTSSGAVYGPQSVEMSSIPENYLGMPDPMNPENAYGIAKRGAEHLCILYANQSKLKIIIARCFAFVGKDLPFDKHFAIGNFLNDAINNRNIIITGDGSPIRTYLDQRDLSDWLIKLLHEGRNGEAYNIGSNKKVSIIDLAQLIKNTINPNIEIIIKENKKESKRQNYTPNIEKISTELGVKINYTLVESILEAINYK